MILVMNSSSRICWFVGTYKFQNKIRASAEEQSYLTFNMVKLCDQLEDYFELLYKFFRVLH